MSERIDVRGDIKIAGGSGDAVRGEVPALTRRVPAGQAGRAIVAEPGAAGQAAVAAVADSRRGSAAVFLAARQARLAAAADEIVAAAEDGSAAALPRPLRKFEALTTALWTVQSELRPAWPAPARAPGRTGSPMRTPDRGPSASGS